MGKAPVIEVIYSTVAFRARISIDGSKHCPFAVMDVTMARMFPDADPKAPDPVFDAIMKRRDAARRAAKGAR